MRVAQVPYRTVYATALEVVDTLNHLATQERNKERIVRAGTLPHYVMLLRPVCSVFNNNLW